MPARVLKMAEEDKELEAINDEAQRHRNAAEKAFAQANIGAAYETVSLQNQEKRAEKKRAKEEKSKAMKKRQAAVLL